MDRDAAVKLVCDAMALDVALKDAAARKANAPFERIRELEAEVERLRKDAERLDWLGNVEGPMGPYGWKYDDGQLRRAYLLDCPRWAKTPREAIDAALAAGEGMKGMSDGQGTR